MPSPEPETESLDVLGKALSCWGGKFRLVCAKCYREMRCDIKPGEYMNADGHRRASLKFWRQGWRVVKVPVCSSCQETVASGLD